MPDDTVLNVGVGGDAIRTILKAGRKTQVVGIDLTPGSTETLMAGAMPVTGTFWPATQPVSLAAPVAVTGTFWQATQPVCGTVTANAGTGTFAVSGTFWQATQPVSVATLPALAAGTNLIGQTAASNETGSIYSGTTALVPKFATFNLSATGTVVAGVGGKRIRVLRWRVSASGTVNVKWQGHAGPTDISGLSYCVAGKDCGGGYCPVGHFQTVSSEALDLNLSAGVSVSGEVTYVEV